MHRCTKCGVEQPGGHYYFDRGRRTHVCKTCVRRRHRSNWAVRLLRNAAANSKQRGHEPPTIDEPWIRAQLLVCPYLNVALVPPDLDEVESGPWAPSLDRIDISFGYHPHNVRLTSLLWNNLRGTMKLSEALSALAVVRKVT